MMTILLALAELEVARIRDGWAHANRCAVARGVHPAPYPPTGYKRSADGRLVPDEPTATLLAEAFCRRARGDSYEAIAQFLQDACTSTSVRNRTWTGETVAGIISNPVYTGEARYGRYRNSSAHEPIVSRALWLSVQPGMPGRAPRPGAKSLLAGLIRCAGCGHAMTKAQSPILRGPRKGMLNVAYSCRNRHARFRCPAPAFVSMNAIDLFVTDRFFELRSTRWCCQRGNSRGGNGRRKSRDD
jgi:hypothetical protein